MKQFITKPIAIIFISILLVMSSCQKQIDVVYQNIPSLQNFTTEAKTWFANGPVLQEKMLLDLPHSVLPENAPERLFARMWKIERKLDWENAVFYNRDAVQYMVVPIFTNQKKYGNDYEISKSIVFYKLNGGEMNMNVIEVLSKKGTSLAGKAKEVLATAFINKVKNKKEAVQGINASLFFYDKNYKNIGNYEFKNGLFAASEKKLTIKSATGTGANNNQISANLSTANSSCQLWGTYYVQYDGNGQIIYWELLYTWYVGDCGGGGNNEEQMPEGTGGGGVPSVEDGVLNLLTDPCQNAALIAIAGVGINNTISQFYNGISTPNSPINLLFIPGNVAGGGPAQTQPSGISGSHHYTTTISDNQFAYGPTLMSQEAWGAIIAHEILHVFILEGGLGFTPANNNYAHHSQIFTHMINTTRDLLQTAFGLDNAVATKLALNGLADLWTNSSSPYAFNDLCMTKYGYSYTQIQATFAQYTTGLLGTRCN